MQAKKVICPDTKLQYKTSKLLNEQTHKKRVNKIYAKNKGSDAQNCGIFFFEDKKKKNIGYIAQQPN